MSPAAQRALLLAVLAALAATVVALCGAPPADAPAALGPVAPPAGGTEGSPERAALAAPEADRAAVPAPPARTAAAPEAPARAPVDAANGSRVVRVVDAQGAAVPGARVVVEAAGGTREVRADGAGEARVPRPARDGPWRARAVADGFLEAAIEVAADAGDTAEVALDRAVPFRGRVVDADTGAPVAGAALRCPLRRTDAESRAETDELGAFVLDVPAGRRSRLLVEAEGYAGEGDWYEAEEGLGLDGCTIALTPLVAGALRARVVDAVTGAPVEGARLRRITSGRRLSFARSDAAGVVRATLASDWREEDLALHVTARGYCGLALRLRSEDLDRAAWVLPLLPPTTVRGRVVDGAGEPVAGARVQVRGRRSAALEPAVRDQLLGAGLDRAALGAGLQVASAPGSAWARTADDGTFEAANLVPWMEGVELEARAGARRSEPVVLEALGGPGEERRVELVVQPSAAVHGVVRVGGEEPTDLRVVWEGDDDRGYVEVEEDGSYAVEGLSAGAVRLELAWAGVPERGWYVPELGARSRVELALAPGERREVPLEVDLVRARVRGRATTDAGEPRAGLPVYARAADREEPRYVAVTERDGSFAFDTAADGGPYEVLLRHGGRWSRRRGVAPGASDVDFVVRGERSVRLRVRDADTGEDVGLYFLSVRADGEDAFRLVAASGGRDADGDGYRAFEVPEDTAALLVHREEAGYRPHRVDDLSRAEHDVELRAGAHVDLRLAPGEEAPPEDAALYVVEVDREFRPPEGAPADSLQFRIDESTDPLLRARRVRFDRGPAARVDGLAPGRYRVVAAGRSLRVLPGEFEVGPDGADVELSWTE